MTTWIQIALLSAGVMTHVLRNCSCPSFGFCEEQEDLEGTKKKPKKNQTKKIPKITATYWPISVLAEMNTSIPDRGR